MEPSSTPSTERAALELRAPRNLVSKRAILWWTIRAAAVWVVLIVGGVIELTRTQATSAWLIYPLITAIVLAVLHVTVMPQWRYRVHRWESTPDAVYTRSGWFNQEWRVAPVSRIQTIDTKRGPLEQVFGLATVTITTASAAGHVEISGVTHEHAARMVTELTAITQATTGDAT